MMASSDWISHLPEEDDTIKYGKVIGVGMNQEELEENSQLTDFVVQDLNLNPKMDFEDESFDVICNVVSVDYLTQPKKIFEEMHRILRPGGLVLMSFSNRCFPTKAVNMWLQADDIGRMTIVGSYFHYTATWDSIEALDILPEKLEKRHLGWKKYYRILPRDGLGCQRLALCNNKIREIPCTS